MNKELKIAKMNMIDIFKAVGVFYIIFIVVISALAVVNAFSNGHSGTSGLEIASMIFIFVCGLNSFKENFYFTQGNNISRKKFIVGIIISIFPVAMFMAFIDFIINRIVNLFMESPTIYDMGYTEFENLSYFAKHNVWIQDNSFMTIINTILLFFTLYCFAYILGIVINMIYFRCNAIMKIAVSVIGGGILLTLLSSDFNSEVYKGVNLILGIETQNVYICILSSIIGSLLLATCTYPLIKGATVKEK